MKNLIKKKITSIIINFGLHDTQKIKIFNGLWKNKKFIGIKLLNKIFTIIIGKYYVSDV